MTNGGNNNNNDSLAQRRNESKNNARAQGGEQVPGIDKKLNGPDRPAE